MTTWNNAPYPTQDPNQGYYAGQPGYPPQAPYPGTGYSNAPQQMYPGGPSHGYPSNPGASYGQPAGGAYSQPGEAIPLSNTTDMYATSYPEDPEVKGFEFTDKSIRRGFIRKVYSILMVQLLITAALISGIYFSDKATRYIYENSWLFFMALVVLLVSMIMLACCGEMRRKSPVNYILLTLFTLAEGFLLAVATTAYDVESILIAVGITAALCLGLTLFAFQTKWDFTLCGGFLFVCVLVLVLFGFIVSIFAWTGSLSTARTLNLVYASLGAIIFSIYLIYDTQLMMGGKHKYAISPEEYIFAALNLYVDIINIFMYILAIVGTARK